MALVHTARTPCTSRAIRIEPLETRQLLSSEVAWQQNPDASGFIVIDATIADVNTARSGQEWSVVTATGSVGGQAVSTLPNSGITYQSGQATPLGQRAPQRDFRVNFLTPGTYYVCARGRGSSSDNSIHTGLDGQELASSDSMTGFGANWTWINGIGQAARYTISVQQAGVHTLNLWCCEDGTQVDNIVLTRDANYQPSGNGPALSQRFAAASISGIVWSDHNLNGQRDSGEIVPHVQLYLDSNFNRSYASGERATSSDVNGAYWFDGLRNGHLPVRIVDEGTGHYQTWSPPATHVDSLPGPNFVKAPVVDDHRQMVYHIGDDSLYQYDLVTGQHLEPIEIGDIVDRGLDISVDGKYLLIGGRANQAVPSILIRTKTTTSTLVNRSQFAMKTAATSSQVLPQEPTRCMRFPPPAGSQFDQAGRWILVLQSNA